MEELESMFFLSGSASASKTMASGAFEYGLYNKSNNIFSTMIYTEATDEDIALKAFNAGFDMVYVVKIPKMILMPSLNNEHKLLDAPLPIWKKVDGRYYLSNELIYGIAYRRTKDFVYNDKYKGIHDPSGLLFDRKQEEYFKENDLEMWTKFSTQRKTMDYTTLFNNDLEKGIWTRFINRYHRHYDSENIIK